MARSSRARKARKGTGSGQAPQPGPAENGETIALGRESNKIAKKALAISAIFGVVGAATALTGLAIPLYQGRSAGPTGPKLEVSAFSAEKLRNVQVDVLDLGFQAGKDQVESPVLDVVLKNVGDQVAVVSSVDFTVQHSEKVETCEKGAGPIEIAGRYDVKIPFPDRPTPFSVRREVRHEIPPGRTERLVFSIGIGKVPLHPDLWLHRIDMHITSDGAVKRIHAGTGIIVTPVPQKGYFLNQKIIPDRNCPAKTLDRFKKFTASPGARSAAFEEILDELTQFAARY